MLHIHNVCCYIDTQRPSTNNIHERQRAAKAASSLFASIDVGISCGLQFKNYGLITPMTVYSAWVYTVVVFVVSMLHCLVYQAVATLCGHTRRPGFGPAAHG